MVSTLQAFAIGGIMGLIGGAIIFTSSGRALGKAAVGAAARQAGKVTSRTSARLEATGR